MKKIAIVCLVLAIILGVLGSIGIKIWSQPYRSFQYENIPSFNYSSQYERDVKSQLDIIDFEMNILQNQREKLELQLARLLSLSSFHSTSDDIKLAAANIVRKDDIDIITNILTLENDTEGKKYLYHSIAVGSLEPTLNISERRIITYIQPGKIGAYSHYSERVDCLGVTFIPDFVGQEPTSLYECESKVRSKKNSKFLEIKSLYFDLERLNNKRALLLQEKMKLSPQGNTDEIWVLGPTLSCLSKQTVDQISDLNKENVFSTEVECQNSSAFWKEYEKRAKSIEIYENGSFLMLFLLIGLLIVGSLVLFWESSKNKNPSKKGLDNEY